MASVSQPRQKSVLPNLLAMKRTARTNLCALRQFSSSCETLFLVSVDDASAREFLCEGLSAIGVAAIAIAPKAEAGTKPFMNTLYAAEIKPSELIAFDAVICDLEQSFMDPIACMREGIVPILPEGNIYSGILTQFNPMRFEGNAFIAKSQAKFCLFERAAAYLENVKFPEDKRVLVKNVLGTV